MTAGKTDRDRHPAGPLAGAPPRRRVLAGIAGAATVAIAGGAAAQLDFRGIDIGGIFSAAQSLFEGFSLGEEDEIKIGVGLYPRMMESFGGAYRNAAVQSAIKRFAEPLIGTTKRGNLPWEIVVLNDDTVNAWALPGGKLAVNKGLLRYTATDAELAAVIGHEIGHIEKAHALAEMKTGKFTEFVGKSGAQAIRGNLDSGGSSVVNDMVLDMLSQAISRMVTTGYSRAAELEADAHLLEVFDSVGYDPKQAGNFYRTLLQLIPEDAEGSTSLFSTHPETRERAERLDTLAEERTKPKFPAASRGFAELKAVFPTRRHFRRNRS